MNVLLLRRITAPTTPSRVEGGICRTIAGCNYQRCMRSVEAGPFRIALPQYKQSASKTLRIGVHNVAYECISHTSFCIFLALACGTIDTKMGIFTLSLHRSNASIHQTRAESPLISSEVCFHVQACAKSPNHVIPQSKLFDQTGCEPVKSYDKQQSSETPTSVPCFW